MRNVLRLLLVGISFAFGLAASQFPLIEGVFKWATGYESGYEFYLAKFVCKGQVSCLKGGNFGVLLLDDKNDTPFVADLGTFKIPQGMTCEEMKARPVIFNPQWSGGFSKRLIRYIDNSNLEPGTNGPTIGEVKGGGGTVEWPSYGLLLEHVRTAKGTTDISFTRVTCMP